MKKIKLDIQKFASSGTLTTPANEDGSYFYLDWNVTNTYIGTNTSRLYWQLNIHAAYTYYTNAVSTGQIIINGQVVHGGGTYSNISRGDHGITGGYIDIIHNDDGTKTFNASISGWTYGCSWVNASGNFELNQIPRASKINSVEITDLLNRTNNIEGTYKVNYTRYYSEFRDNLKILVNGNLLKTIENYVSDDEFTLSNSELNTLYTEMANSNSINLTFKMQTYNGQTLIGEGQTYVKKCYIYDADPTFSGVSFEDTNNTTTALTGNNQIIVKGYSNATITIPVATGNKGATIVDYVIEGVDNPISHTGSQLSYTINSCDFGIFNVYARDSRGNTTLSTAIATSIKSYENIYLNVQTSKIERWENGSQSATGDEAKLTLNGTIWNDNFGSVDNSITSSSYQLKITDSSGSPIVGTTDITPTINQNGTITFTGLIRSDNPDYSWNLDDSYYIYITIADALSNYTITLTLNSGKPNIAIHKNGVGIGAPYDVSKGGSLQIDGNLAPIALNNYSTSQTDTYNCDYINSISKISIYSNSTQASGTDSKTSITFVAPFDGIIEINGVCSTWGFDGGNLQLYVSNTQGSASEIASYNSQTNGHNGNPVPLVAKAFYSIVKNTQYTFNVVLGGRTGSTNAIKIIGVLRKESL